MRLVKVAAVQMRCSVNVDENIKKGDEMVRSAAASGANIILLPELFERQYFCQERRYEYYDFAKSVEENDAVNHFQAVAKELSVVIPVSFYEKDGTVLYNSVAVIDADGEILGVYRKTHIPDDHFYQEKFYFTPGNTGFKTWKTKFGTIGVGICWDQWFPETARAMALQGAEMLLGHAGSNLMPVIAANRIGLEIVEPCKENAMQSSSLEFYGSSFMTDETGEILESASRDKEEILIHTYDLDEIYENRMSWGIFRDRRPECYGDLL